MSLAESFGDLEMPSEASDSILPKQLHLTLTISYANKRTSVSVRLQPLFKCVWLCLFLLVHFYLFFDHCELCILKNIPKNIDSDNK